MFGNLLFTRRFLLINVVILFLWNLGLLFPMPEFQADDPTLTPVETETFPPTETMTSMAADPVTPSFTESPTVIPPTVTASTVSATVPLDQASGGEISSEEVLVRFRRNASKESIARCMGALNATIKSKIENLNTLVVLIPREKGVESLSRFEACPDVRYAEPNYLVQIADVFPSDPDWGNQYGLINIRAPQGWAFTTGSSSIIIAVIDTGIDLNHPDLAGKIVQGVDLFNNDAIPQDDNGHGTHVAGIAAAISNNSIGVAGVSWGARLMPIKVLNAGGNGTYADVANGIIWATDHGAQVINLSLGGSNPSQTLQNAVDYAIARGVILVAAAGNTGANQVLYPAHYADVIAVAATDNSNTRAGFSNYGPEIDLSAPGVSIYSTSIGGYGYRNGTSMATPYVSGLAAILRGIPGNATPSSIAQQMQSTALDLGSSGWDDFYGYGLIQMDAAIRLVWVEPTNTSISMNPPGGFVPPPTFPSTLTVTSLPTQTETVVATAIVPSLEISPRVENETSTTTPEVIALDISERSGQTWLMPICGVSFILVGLMLLWLVRREKESE